MTISRRGLFGATAVVAGAAALPAVSRETPDLRWEPLKHVHEPEEIIRAAMKLAPRSWGRPRAVTPAPGFARPDRQIHVTLDPNWRLDLPRAMRELRAAALYPVAAWRVIQAYDIRRDAFVTRIDVFGA